MSLAKLNSQSAPHFLGGATLVVEIAVRCEITLRNDGPSQATLSEPISNQTALVKSSPQHFHAQPGWSLKSDRTWVALRREFLQTAKTFA